MARFAERIVKARANELTAIDIEREKTLDDETVKTREILLN